MNTKFMKKMTILAALASMGATTCCVGSVSADEKAPVSDTTRGRIDHKEDRYATYDRNFPKDYTDITVTGQQLLNYMVDKGDDKDGISLEQILKALKIDKSDRITKIRIISESNKNGGSFDIHITGKGMLLYGNQKVETQFNKMVYDLICKDLKKDLEHVKDREKAFQNIIGALSGINGSDLKKQPKTFFVRNWGFRGYENSDDQSM